VNDISGQCLANLIIAELKGLNIEIKNLWCQVYDCAAIMSGNLNGVTALIRKEYLSICNICIIHIL
jgi:hypothetical protein